MPARREQLAQPLIVIRVLVREDHGVDGVAVQRERIEVATEHRGVGAAVHEHGGPAILHEDRVALADVEHAHHELARRGALGDGCRSAERGEGEDGKQSQSHRCSVSLATQIFAEFRRSTLMDRSGKLLAPGSRRFCADLRRN